MCTLHKGMNMNNGPSPLMITIIAAVLIVIVSVNALLEVGINDVIDGKAELWCEFKDGIRQVDPSLIKYEHEGTWVFTNGHASNCKISKKPGESK